MCWYSKQQNIVLNLRHEITIIYFLNATLLLLVIFVHMKLYITTKCLFHVIYVRQERLLQQMFKMQSIYYLAQLKLILNNSDYFRGNQPKHIRPFKSSKFDGFVLNTSFFKYPHKRSEAWRPGSCNQLCNTSSSSVIASSLTTVLESKKFFLVSMELPLLRSWSCLPHFRTDLEEPVPEL